MEAVFDESATTVVDSLDAGGQTRPLALDGETLWYGTLTSDFLGRIDTTDTIRGRLELPGPADKGATRRRCPTRRITGIPLGLFEGTAADVVFAARPRGDDE